MWSQEGRAEGVAILIIISGDKKSLKCQQTYAAMLARKYYYRTLFSKQAEYFGIEDDNKPNTEKIIIMEFS